MPYCAGSSFMVLCIACSDYDFHEVTDLRVRRKEERKFKAVLAIVSIMEKREVNHNRENSVVLVPSVVITHSAVHNDVLHVQSSFQGEYWSTTAQRAAEIDYIIITA